MIIIPVEASSINSNKKGYELIISFYYKIISCKNNDKVIVLDFKNVSWIDANITAIIGAIFQILEYNGFQITISNLNNEISNIFNRNGFYYIGRYHPSSVDDTVITYYQFSRNQHDFFLDYVEKEILSKTCFPLCSEVLRQEITSNLFELYGNAVTHGKAYNIFTCGQHYPQKDPARLDFTIVDIGNTFLKNINEYNQLKNTPMFSNGYDAIEWATKERNSTKTDGPGGLGLSLLLDFIKANKGKIQIISDNGYWDSSIKKYQTIAYKFPGAIINIEFNVDESNEIYLLKRENHVLIQNIF